MYVCVCVCVCVMSMKKFNRPFLCRSEFISTSCGSFSPLQMVIQMTWGGSTNIVI